MYKSWWGFQVFSIIGMVFCWPPAGKKERGKTLWHCCCNLDPRRGWFWGFYHQDIMFTKENDMPVLLINFYTWGRTCMWRGQSLEFQLSQNSCQIWTGRVYWRPLYVGLRGAQRCPHSPLKPICKSHLVHILWYDFGLKWAVYNSNCTFGLLEAYLKVLQLVSLNIG